MSTHMTSRLIIAIVSTASEEVAVLLIGLWLLPRLGVRIPIWLLGLAMIVWLGWSVFTYQKGSRALRRKPLRGLIDMRGMNGIVVRSLSPNGMIKIGGELWSAQSVAGRIEVGKNVAVVSQEGLKLLVREADSDAAAPPVQQRQDYHSYPNDR